MKAETNNLQDQLTAALADGAKWWGLDGSAERVYLNPPRFAGTRYAKTIKLWLTFADAATLAGAEFHVRVDIAQHPNWIAAEEAKWEAEFEHVLDAVAAVREEAGLDGQQEAAAVEEKEMIDATTREALQDEAAADRRQAMLDIEMKRAAASRVSEIVNQYGNVDVRILLPAHFTVVDAAEDQLSGFEYARAMTGFSEPTTEKRWSRRRSYTASVPALPQFGGWVIATADLPKVLTLAQLAAAKEAAAKAQRAAAAAAKKLAAQDAGFPSVAAHERSVKVAAEKADAARRAAWEAQRAAGAKTFFAGRLESGNIAIRDGNGAHYCLVIVGPQAGKWVEGATFPAVLASQPIAEATSARDAADRFAALQPA